MYENHVSISLLTYTTIQKFGVSTLKNKMWFFFL